MIRYSNNRSSALNNLRLIRKKRRAIGNIQTELCKGDQSKCEFKQFNKDQSIPSALSPAVSKPVTRKNNDVNTFTNNDEVFKFLMVRKF